MLSASDGASKAPGEGQIRAKYHVSPEVSSLGLTLYVLGFAFGPLLWGTLANMVLLLGIDDVDLLA